MCVINNQSCISFFLNLCSQLLRYLVYTIRNDELKNYRFEKKSFRNGEGIHNKQHHISQFKLVVQIFYTLGGSLKTFFV